MSRIQRALAALSVLFSVLFLATPILSGPADAAMGVGWHEGRLGGSQDSFEQRFGQGSGSASSGVSYTADGYDAIVVKFDKDRAVDIVLTSPVGVSWTTDQAFNAALDLLPEGVRLVATPIDSGDGRLDLTCQSSKLAKEFSSSDYKRLKHAGSAGECFVLESPDSPTTITALELSVGRAGVLKKAAPTATATTSPPLSIIPPTPTPDTRTYVADDGCTYMVATGAFVSCPAQAPSENNDGGGNVEPAPAPADPTNGATALCNDGTLSYAASHQGACSHHGGVATWYK